MNAVHAMTLDDTEDLHLLQRALGVPDWPAARLRRLVEASRHVVCPVGPLALASPRRPEPSWWLVRSGRVALGRRLGDGHFEEVQCIGAGEWLDVAGALTPPGTWLDDVECREPTELLAVPVAALWHACGRDPDGPAALTRVMAGRLRERSAAPGQAVPPRDTTH